MFESFIPSSAQQLQDHDAIALLQHLRRVPISVFGLVANDLPTTVSTAVIKPDASPNKLAPNDTTPLLLLHGFDSSLLEFRHLLPLLAPHRSAYALDLLGFGFTERLPSMPVEPRTIRQHLYDTWKALLDRPMILVGASLGGAVAIDFTLNYPDCVERLILVDSVGFSGSFPLGKLLLQPLLDWGTDWLHVRKDSAYNALEALQILSPDQQDWVLAASLHQEMPGWKEAIMSFTRSGGYSYLAPRIHEVYHPTLVLWGAEDRTLGTEDAHKFEHALPQSQLIWIEGADHAPHISCAKAVAEHILTWQ